MRVRPSQTRCHLRGTRRRERSALETTAAEGGREAQPGEPEGWPRETSLVHALRRDSMRTLTATQRFTTPQEKPLRKVRLALPTRSPRLVFRGTKRPPPASPGKIAWLTSQRVSVVSVFLNGKTSIGERCYLPLYCNFHKSKQDSVVPF